MKLSDFSPAVPSDLQIAEIEFYTKLYSMLAGQILNTDKPSAHRTAALRLLLESKMTLIHGITHPSES